MTHTFKQIIAFNLNISSNNTLSLEERAQVVVIPSGVNEVFGVIELVKNVILNEMNMILSVFLA